MFYYISSSLINYMIIKYEFRSNTPKVFTLMSKFTYFTYLDSNFTFNPMKRLTHYPLPSPQVSLTAVTTDNLHSSDERQRGVLSG